MLKRLLSLTGLLVAMRAPSVGAWPAPSGVAGGVAMVVVQGSDPRDVTDVAGDVRPEATEPVDGVVDRADADLTPAVEPEVESEKVPGETGVDTRPTLSGIADLGAVSNESGDIMNRP